MYFVASINRLLKNPFVFAYSALVFILPLVLSKETNELYEFPKTTFLYTFCILLTGVFLSVLIYKPRRLKKVHLSVAVFLFSALISTLLSVHPSTSFFGYYTRFTDSLVFYAAMLALFYIATNVLKSENFETVFNFASAGSVILFFYALSQYSGIFNFLWKGQLQDRVFSTLGQPNWYAQYLVLLIGINFYNFLSKGSKVNLLFYGVQFVSLWLTFSMSGFAGFLALVVINLFIVFRKKEIEIKRIVLLKRLALMAVIGVATTFIFPGIFRQKLQDIFIDAQKVAQSAYVVHASSEEQSGNMISDPGYIRAGLWSGTMSLITSSPKVFIFGTGPETFPYVFQKFRPAVLNYSSEWDFVLNKPHNYYLETWAEQGLIGVLSYFYLLFYVIKKSPQMYKSSLVAFVVTNIFGWPSVVPAVIFWIMVSSTEKEI